MAKIPVPPTRRRRTDTVKRTSASNQRAAANQVAAGRLKARAGQKFPSSSNVHVGDMSAYPPPTASRAGGFRPVPRPNNGPDIGRFAQGVSRDFGRGVAQTGAAFGEVGNRIGAMIPGAKPNQISTSIKVGQQGNNPLQKQLQKR